MKTGLVVVTAFVLVAGGWLFWLSKRLAKIHGSASSRSSSPETFLTYSPNSINSADLWAITFAILAKYLPGTSGYRNRLVPQNNAFPLPLMRLRGPLRFTEEDVQTFQQALALINVPDHHSPSGEQAQSTENPFLLVSLTNPLLLVLLSHPRCPIRPLGAVNTQNTIKFHRTATCSDSNALLKESNAGRLWFTATFGGPSKPGRPRRRGVEFDITIQVWLGDDPVLTQNLAFLQFLPKSQRIRYRESEAKSSTSKSTQEEEGSVLLTTPLKLNVTAPRKWAASCKDYNPIHVSGLAAKLFGFPSVILHGNHAIALALEGLRRDQAYADSFGNTIRSLKVDMSFVKPMTLPAALQVQWTKSLEGLRFEIVDSKGKVCVVGGLVGS